MPKNNITNILPFTHDELFDLVKDIEKYPEFLPWCSAARIIKHINDDMFHAELIINYKAFRANYISCVELKKNAQKSEINVSLIKGPFNYLNNQWVFNSNNGETEVTFMIDFELKFNFMDKIVNTIFEKAFTKMYKAFYDRAEYLYNQNGANCSGTNNKFIDI